MMTLSTEDYLWFVDDCLDTMATTLERLGDDLACTAPDLPGANSPYAIVTHCLGVLEFWGGRMVRGREIQRDRDAEFRATGKVADLVARVPVSRQRFAEDLSALDPQAPPAGEVRGPDRDLPFGRSQAGVLMHVFHELAQHLGHLEITRDVLEAAPPAHA